MPLRSQFLAFKGHRPRVHASAFVAQGARVIGRVVIGKSANIWFNAVLRGDVETLAIGEFSNVQDCAVLHADPGFPLHVGRRVTIGHSAIVHGCEIGDETLVGMGAILMNGVRLGRQCLVGAGALLTENFSAPDGSLIYGAPAKIVSQLGPRERSKLKKSAVHYAELAREYRRQNFPISRKSRKAASTLP